MADNKATAAPQAPPTASKPKAAKLTEADKQAAFRKVAEPRTQKVLEAIVRLSRCANPRSYAFNEAQVTQIMEAITGQLQTCASKFTQALEGSAPAEGFKLS